MRWALLFIVTFVAQRLLGLPGLPAWGTGLLLPAVWLVAVATGTERPSPLFVGLGVGAVWDIVMEPVLGPGAIAWSATAVLLAWTASWVADRSPRMWAALGALAAASVHLVRWLALLPLGEAAPVRWSWLAVSMTLTGLWCGIVGWSLTLDLTARWARYRRQRLH
ncbi:MAG: hypothetical protein LJE95_06965 [Acidobacteria bacterium]|jgi:hypothetical protein|nr:hypothetical protein [Acidobacteriota bacterium]